MFMNRKPIDRAVAKAELKRINDVLAEPHLLIGGLAIQQYYSARISKDIDLVCDFDVAQHILDTLYPSRDWKVYDKQNDEYRPSFQIRHKVEDIGTIIFGPKISERPPYNHIDWERLKEGAQPFVTAAGLLEKILVPAAHALAYTKFISFLGRHAPEDKVKADLKDFADITNHENFSVSLFYDLLRRSKSFEELSESFRAKASNYTATLESSCLSALAPMFMPTPILESSKLSNEITHVQGIEPGKSEQIKTLRVTVASPEEFFEAIGSNRVIEVTAGSFDLSSVQDRYMKHIRWDPEHDGRTVTIRDVENLIIRGTGLAKTRLLVVPRYAYVLALENCRGIEFSDLTMGHAPAGDCTGGVLSVLNSEGVRVTRCALFGSGTEGLTLRVVRTFRMTDSEVFDCTYGIATIESCKDIIFAKTTFHNNREFYGFAIRDSEYIEFADANVHSNQCPEDLFDIVSSWPVRFIGGTIDHNKCKGLGSVDTQGTVLQADLISAGRQSKI
jgi:hypothetical protein